MLHHVKPTPRFAIGPLADYSVTPSELEAYLLDRSEWEPVTELSDFSFHKGGFLLTFDDGYQNNLTDALPVLEEHEVPCLIFVVTGFIDGSVYPYELELAEVVKHASVLAIPDRSEPAEIQSLSRRQSLYRGLRLPLKPATRTEREAYMDRLARLNDYDRSDMQKEPLLNWDDVRELGNHPLVTIGAHTHSHVLLSRQSWQTAWEEITRSKQRLEEQIGERVRYFSYPYGGNSIAVRQMVRWAGFQFGFTTRARRMDRITDWNRYALPRIDISELLPDDA
jgi:peptidoglycan/xylan/chitin deacetylase (PgdA/CDA1 family)